MVDARGHVEKNTCSCTRQWLYPHDSNVARRLVSPPSTWAYEFAKEIIKIFVRERFVCRTYAFRGGVTSWGGFHQYVVDWSSMPIGQGSALSAASRKCIRKIRKVYVSSFIVCCQYVAMYAEGMPAKRLAHYAASREVFGRQQEVRGLWGVRSIRNSAKYTRSRLCNIYLAISSIVCYV